MVVVVVVEILSARFFQVLGVVIVIAIHDVGGHEVVNHS